MKPFFAICAVLCTAAISANAQEQQTETASPVTEARPAQADQPKLLAEEERIRVGIVLLAGLHDILARVQDKESAEAAVAPIMRFITQLQNWGHSFNALPPLSEETRDLYEQRYLPIIERLNARIQVQAERLASAEFYGSRNLPAALVKLVADFQ